LAPRVRAAGQRVSGARDGAILLPQAVPNLPVYVNIAQVFYPIGLNATALGVVLMHSSHRLVLP